MAHFGSAVMSDLSPECAPKRTSVDHFEFMGSRPNSMECDIIDFRALSAMAKARRRCCVRIRDVRRISSPPLRQRRTGSHDFNRSRANYMWTC
jgi:hypothetical protein